VITLTSSNN
jgi:hypothetical protein